MINTTSAVNFLICRYFSFYEQLKFCDHLSWAWKKFYNLWAWSLQTVQINFETSGMILMQIVVTLIGFLKQLFIPTT